MTREERLEISMRHPDRETLERYLSGTLPAGVSDGLQRHLFLCPACEERLVALVPGPVFSSSSPALPDEDYRGVIHRLLDPRDVEVAAVRRRLTAERAAASGLWREVGSEPREPCRRRVLAEP